MRKYCLRGCNYWHFSFSVNLIPFFLVIGGYVSKIMGKKEQTNKAYIISRLLWVNQLYNFFLLMEVTKETTTWHVNVELIISLITQGTKQKEYSFFAWLALFVIHLVSFSIHVVVFLKFMNIWKTTKLKEWFETEWKY